MRITRRVFLAAAGGVVLAGAPGRGRATPAAMQAAIGKLTGGAPVRTGRVKLDVPPLVDNGNAVALSVTVDSPMTPTDYVKAIHVVTEKNPQPYVVSAFLGPRAGRAQLATRVRLADSQTVIALAELGDGSFWSDAKDVIVTLAACTEELTS